jgi:hypothetical protein
MNNYRNRRARGQCAACTNQALAGEVRCAKCKAKHREQYNETRDAMNAKRREKAFRESLERERRLEELDERLKAEVAALEAAWQKVAAK